MAPSSLLALLSLALSVQSWPQHPFDPEDAGMAMTLPIIGLSHMSKKSLPHVDESAGPGTLPIPYINARSFPAEAASAGTFTLPIIHVPKPGLFKRDDAIEVQLENRSDVAYYAQLNIGTPPQTVFAQLDTGSFELWVNPNCGVLSTSDQRFCQAVGRYNPGASSSADVTTNTATLRYGIGEADITYVKDDISLPGSSTMKNVQFGIASDSKDQFSGILGIGHGKGINTLYNNFVDELAAQGLTSGKTYSVGLGSKAEGAGVIVFGGIDTAKFKGSLAPLPIIPGEDSPDGVARFWVQMKSLSVSTPDGETKAWSNSGMPVFLDTGATLTLLPQDLVKGVANTLGAQTADSTGFYQVDCALADQDGSINFEFQGVTINVPYKEMIRVIGTTQPSTCYLGMMPSNSFALLGDTFLRSAYVAFDLDKNMTYMAQYTNCGSSPKTITSSTDLENVSSSCGVNKPVSPPPASSSKPSSSQAPAPQSSLVKSPKSSSAAAQVSDPPTSTSTKKLWTTTVERQISTQTVDPKGVNGGAPNLNTGAENKDSQADKDSPAMKTASVGVGALMFASGVVMCLMGI